MATGISSIKSLQLLSYEVIELFHPEKDMFLLRVPKTDDFLAGQVVGITSDASIEPRLYSIASGEKDPWMDILYTPKQDGKLTPILAKLKSGDGILISKPFGEFTRCEPESYWITNGTGIAPFNAMLRSGKGLDNVLIYGNRSLSSFYFREELYQYLGDRYLKCSSAGAPGCFQGRVTDFILQLENLKIDKQFYLCGSAEMVVDVRDILISKGVSFKNINAEIYF